jgi:hypothetical protein
MSNPTLCDRREITQGNRGLLSLVHLITDLGKNFSFKRRKYLTAADLTPELMRDIGLEEAPPRLKSLEENWRRELELLSR